MKLSYFIIPYFILVLCVAYSQSNNQSDPNMDIETENIQQVGSNEELTVAIQASFPNTAAFVENYIESLKVEKRMLENELEYSKRLTDTLQSFNTFLHRSEEKLVDSIGILLRKYMAYKPEEAPCDSTSIPPAWFTIILNKYNDNSRETVTRYIRISIPKKLNIYREHKVSITIFSDPTELDSIQSSTDYIISIDSIPMPGGIAYNPMLFSNNDVKISHDVDSGSQYWFSFTPLELGKVNLIFSLVKIPIYKETISVKVSMGGFWIIKNFFIYYWDEISTFILALLAVINRIYDIAKHRRDLRKHKLQAQSVSKN